MQVGKAIPIWRHKNSGGSFCVKIESTSGNCHFYKMKEFKSKVFCIDVFYFFLIHVFYSRFFLYIPIWAFTMLK